MYYTIHVMFKSKSWMDENIFVFVMTYMSIYKENISCYTKGYQKNNQDNFIDTIIHIHVYILAIQVYKFDQSPYTKHYKYCYELNMADIY